MGISSIDSGEVTFVDLFAGIGGFAAALHSFGAQPFIASEFDESASEIYRKNWGISAYSDVTLIAPDEVTEDNEGIGAHDILTGGFPCQPFSKSGSQMGVLDASRGTLFHNITNAIQTGKPSMVVLENVRNLAGPKHKKDLDIMLESLRHLGYRVSDQLTFVSPHKIHPDLGGRPQSRERLFIVATRIPEGHKTSKTIGPVDVYGNLPKKWDVSKWDAKKFLQNLPKTDEENLEISPSEEFVIASWQKLIEILRNQGIPVPSFPIWTEFWGQREDLERFPSWKAKLIQRNQDFYFEHKVILDAWSKDCELFTNPAFTPSKRKLEWQAGSMETIMNGIIQFRPSGVRVKPATYFPALVAITQTPIIGPLNRRLSVNDAKHLQGLPSKFSFFGQSPAKSYKQLGNGVNVAAVWWVIRSAIERDRDLLELTDRGRKILSLFKPEVLSPDEYLKNFRPSDR